MNVSRIKGVLAYALVVAAEADDRRNRELGPIHLLKYLYLADLAHAEEHAGESYTGVNWRFHKFGPWAVEAFEQIEPLMAALGADRRQFTSAEREDNVRWRLSGDQGESWRSALPGEVAAAVARTVHSFGSDTSALLHFVYQTAPMLRATPGDRLNLKPAPRNLETPPPAERLARVILSKTKKGKLRDEIQRRFALKKEGRQRFAAPPPALYDQVFQDGVAWLDGAEPEPRTGKLSFSDDVWTSRGRGETDLP